jgi:hypothetical protein
VVTSDDSGPVHVVVAASRSGNSSLPKKRWNSSKERLVKGGEYASGSSFCAACGAGFMHWTTFSKPESKSGISAIC